ncbi:hypothetical protein IFVP136_C1240396 [Vibrio parahaemolyticus]
MRDALGKHFSSIKHPGGVPEWPKGADCKSAGSAFDGSNPSPSTIFCLVIIS